MKGIPRSLPDGSEFSSFTEAIVVLDCPGCGEIWIAMYEPTCWCVQGGISPDWNIVYQTEIAFLKRILPACVMLL